jgi:hypothetical protein
VVDPKDVLKVMDQQKAFICKEGVDRLKAGSEFYHARIHLPGLLLEDNKVQLLDHMGGAKILALKQ